VHYFSKEVDWATFWATFSQTHLVTLTLVPTLFQKNNTFPPY
jgi:hypothetical protein